MASANMHRFVLALKIKIVSIKDILDKEKNPNIRLDAKFFVENDSFKQRGHKGSKGKDGGNGSKIGKNRNDSNAGSNTNYTNEIL